MRRLAIVLCVAFLAGACASDRQIGRRYRAERDLWRANWEFQNLSMRPKEVSKDRWMAMASMFESIAARCLSPTGAMSKGQTRQELQTLAARALFNAAQIHETVFDSVGVERIYVNMAQEFKELPPIAGKVALARGRIAERRGLPGQAADLYQGVVDRIDPDPGKSGVAGVVMDLPLRIARLRSAGVGEGERADCYAAARAYYERLANDADSGIEASAVGHLAQVAGDLGDWDQAKRYLRLFESQMRKLKAPPQAPADVRFAIAQVEGRSGAAPESIRATLASVLDDYPKCRIGPQVLMALAENADVQNRMEEALGYLDRVGADYKTNIDAQSQALLARCRLLERHDRWSEALAGLRELPTQYPLSEEALLTPLEIVNHYKRVHDDQGAGTALSEAEQSYRDFIDKYPKVPLTFFARERLAQTLVLEEKYEPAVTEMVSLGEDMRDSPRGAAFLLGAADLAKTKLMDKARAVSILDRAAQLYQSDDVGRWAASEAQSIRGAASP